jgi:hypothetical protein
MKSIKNSSIANYKVFMNLIDKYEELNLASYVDGNPDHMILGDVKNAELKNQMDHMVDNLKNPFEEVYHWIKGETYDLKALAESIEIRDQVES